MDLKEGATVFAIIKATEVSIEKESSFFVLPRGGTVGWITARSDHAVTGGARSTESSISKEGVRSDS